MSRRQSWKQGVQCVEYAQLVRKRKDMIGLTRQCNSVDYHVRAEYNVGVHISCIPYSAKLITIGKSRHSESSQELAGTYLRHRRFEGTDVRLASEDPRSAWRERTARSSCTWILTLPVTTFGYGEPDQLSYDFVFSRRKRRRSLLVNAFRRQKTVFTACDCKQDLTTVRRCCPRDDAVCGVMSNGEAP